MSVVCSKCKKPIGKAVVVIEEMYVCGECVYFMEYGETEAQTRARALPVQEETLFPVERYTNKGYSA